MTSRPGPAAPGGSGSGWKLLAEAAEAIQADSGAVREDAASPEEASQAVSRILAELTHTAAITDLEPASPLARRLVVLLRSGFLVRVADAVPQPDLPELLEVLQALDHVESRLQPAWDEHFSDRMSGPDGLELVVEVAHDLRSPLTSILFLAETLLRGRSGPVTALQERQLGLIYSAAFGLNAVASDVVELVRGRDRPTDLDPMPFSITEILESVRDIVRPIAEEKGLEVHVVTPDRPFRVGYPVALNRVLLNLVTNALKFTEEGRVEMSVTEGEDNVVEFSVRDTGRGIPPQAMALLFEPFRRRQRAREYAFSGSGLGLSICRKFVEAMGSELEVETALGKGTRFSFALALPEPDFGGTLTADSAMIG